MREPSKTSNLGRSYDGAISFRLSGELLGQIKALAAEGGVPVPQILRSAVMQKIIRDRMGI